MNELSTNCPHFEACSGCTLLTDMQSPFIWQDVKKYFTERNVALELEVGSLTQWRIKSKLAIRGTSKNPKIGLFLVGTHEIRPIPHCRAHHPLINRAVQTIEQAIVQEKIALYQEKSTLGLLRYLQCLIDLSTNRVQLALVVQSEDLSLQRLIQKLLTQPELWHSIWVNVQPFATNQILGNRWIHMYGDRFLFQKIAHRTFAFHPAAFTQAHWTLFETLASYVVEQVPLGSHLLEIYAGVGIMGILASNRCKTVHLIENNPFSYLSFQATSCPSNVYYHLKDAKEAASFLPQSDCILLDPPRKGLDAVLLKSLQTASGKIIYVSCNFRSFGRDADALIDAGWILKQAKGYLLFPGTNQVEIVAVLEKSICN